MVTRVATSLKRSVSALAYLGALLTLVSADLAALAAVAGEQLGVGEQIGRHRESVGGLGDRERTGRLDDQQIAASHGGLSDESLLRFAVLERSNRSVDLRLLRAKEMRAAFCSISPCECPLLCARAGRFPTASRSPASLRREPEGVAL